MRHDKQKTGCRCCLLASFLWIWLWPSKSPNSQPSYQIPQLSVYKLGYTSQVMRHQMGIMSPNWGRLTKAMDLRESPQPLLAHPRVEPKIAIVTNLQLSGVDLTLEEIQRSIRSVQLALEIVDMRYVDDQFTLEDNTADASSAAAFVLGPASNFESLVRSETVEFREDDVFMAEGRTADVIGGPIFSLKWLVEELSKRSLGWKLA